MLSKSIVSGLLRRPFSRRNTINNAKGIYFSRDPLCTVADSSENSESHELPDWVYLFDTRDPQSAPSDDDNFVIPSLADWIETQKVEDHGKQSRLSLGEDKDSEIDQISSILKKRYSTPESVVEALNGCAFDASSSLVERLLRKFSNDWIPAFGVFNWAKAQTGYRHSPELYNSMVDVLGKAKKFGLVWELLEEMTNLKGYVALTTMTKIIRRLSRAGKYDEAIETFRGIEKYGLRKDTSAMNVLMDALVKDDNVEKANEIFLELKNSVPPELSSFNILIHGWCKAKKLDEAWKTMEEIEKQGFHPDVVSYTALIEASCQEKDFRRVQQILEEMKVKGCKPNTVTYTIIMHALGKAKQINDSLNIYEKMKAEGCVPDSSFYSSLIFVLGKAGRLKDALEVFDEMPRQGLAPDVMTYNTLIASACESEQEETALRLFRKMEENSCKPDLKTYHPLLKMCCRKKRMKVLRFLIEHMFKNDVSIEAGTYAIVITGLCKSGKAEMGCLLFEEMASKGMVLKESTYKKFKEILESKNMVAEMDRVEKLMAQIKKT